MATERSFKQGTRTRDEQSDNADDSVNVELLGQVDGCGPGTNVLMPDIYANEFSATVPDLKILGESSSKTDESEGFNPYDTAVFVKK